MDLQDHALNYQFGVFELSGRTGELRKKGVVIRLPPQPTLVLRLLVASGGELVTRDELQSKVWAGDTVVDFELGLNRCVRRIRTVLLDDANIPRYIETVPRVGYRFIAPVRVVPALPPRGVSSRAGPSPDLKEPASAPPPPAPQSIADQTVPISRLHAESTVDPVFPADALPAAVTPTPTLALPAVGEPAAVRVRKPSPMIWIVAVAAALVLAGVLRIWVFHPNPETTASAAKYTITPFTIEPGISVSPTFSPDGRKLAFAWNGPRQDNYDIYIKTVGTEEVVRLTKSPETDFSPAWSPDGKYIAFCRSTDNEGAAIWLISLADGTERRLAEQRSAIPSTRHLAWSPDSQRIVYSGMTTDAQISALLELNVASGAIQYLTHAEGGAVDMQPAYAPNGRWVAFVRDIGRGVGRLLLIPMKPEGGADGPPVSLQWPGFESAYLGLPAWTPDSKNLLFASNRRSEAFLWMTTVEPGATPRPLEALGTGMLDATISSTGDLMMVRERSDADIYRLDLKRVRDHETVTPEPVVNSTRMELNPKVSPDGLHLAFESNRSGPTEIWTTNIDGSNLTQITNLGHANTGSPVWSPDGSKIAFDSRTGGSPRIYVIPAGVTGKVETMTSMAEISVVPAWSADGAWLYFTSDRTGRPEVWRISTNGGAAQQISRNGGFAPVSSRTQLVYGSNRSMVTSLRVLDLQSHQETLVAEDVVRRAYFAAENGIYYVSDDGSGHQALKFLPSVQQPAQTLYRFQKPVRDALSLTPDGRFLFFGEAEQTGSELLLVRHFYE